MFSPPNSLKPENGTRLLHTAINSLNSSSIFDFIDIVLDSMVPGENRLVISIEFFVVGYFIVKVYFVEIRGHMRHIGILVVVVRRLYLRRWKAKTLLAGPSPTSPIRRRLPTPLFPTISWGLLEIGNSTVTPVVSNLRIDPTLVDEYLSFAHFFLRP